MGLRKSTYKFEFAADFPAFAIQMGDFARLLSEEQKKMILDAVQRDKENGKENSEEGLLELAKAAKIMDAAKRDTNKLLNL